MQIVLYTKYCPRPKDKRLRVSFLYLSLALATYSDSHFNHNTHVVLPGFSRQCERIVLYIVSESSHGLDEQRTHDEYEQDDNAADGYSCRHIGGPLVDSVHDLNGQVALHQEHQVDIDCHIIKIHGGIAQGGLRDKSSLDDVAEIIDGFREIGPATVDAGISDTHHERGISTGRADVRLESVQFLVVPFVDGLALKAADAEVGAAKGTLDTHILLGFDHLQK